MSAFIAGTPVTAKVVAKPIARRDVTVRAAANSDGLNRRAAVAGVLALFAAAPANAETKRVRAKEAVAPKNAFTKGTGKAPRAFLKDEKAEVLTAYGLTSLPGQ